MGVMDSGADSLLAGESGAAAAACSGSGSMATPQLLKGVAGAVGLGPDAANTSLGGGGGGRGGSALGARTLSVRERWLVAVDREHACNYS